MRTLLHLLEWNSKYPQEVLDAVGETLGVTPEEASTVLGAEGWEIDHENVMKVPRRLKDYYTHNAVDFVELDKFSFAEGEAIRMILDAIVRIGFDVHDLPTGWKHTHAQGEDRIERKTSWITFRQGGRKGEGHISPKDYVQLIGWLDIGD